MNLTSKEKHAFKLWFEFLKICLNDNNLIKKINKNYYKDWHLDQVKKRSFDLWFKSHKKLFIEKKPLMKLVKNTKEKDKIFVSIPVNYTVTQVNKEIGKLLNGKINKKLSKFKIVGRNLLIDSLIKILITIKNKKKYPKLKLSELWFKIEENLKNNYPKISFSGKKENKEFKTIVVSKNIYRANKILQNVIKGIFPGSYYY